MVLRRATGGADEVTPPAVTAALQARRGRGLALDRGARAFFEPRFGTDLSSVRTHADAEAQAMARALNARAFTWGSDVYFANGAWAPTSRDGRRLLAHELAHVLQQRRAGSRSVQPWIQRDGPYRIRGEIRPPERASEDANRIYFDYNSARIEESQEAVLQALIARSRANPHAEIVLTGMASEEGAQAHNQRLAQRRMAAVAARLRAAGFTNVRYAPPSLSGAEGQVDYRRQRYVSIGVDAGCSSDQAQADLRACETAFAAAFATARATCQDALAALRAADPAVRRRMMDELGVDSFAEVLDLVSVVGRAVQATEPAGGGQSTGFGHTCHDRCDFRSAHASGGVDGVHIYYRFYGDHGAPPQRRPWIVIHEAAHGTGEFSDIRYAHQWGAEQLPRATRQFNADTITRIIVEFGDPGGPVWNARSRTPEVRGANSRLIAALGELQWALTLAVFDQEHNYAYAHQARQRGAWPCAIELRNAQLAAGITQGRFGLVGPPAQALENSCTAPLGPAPSLDEQVRLAGIRDQLRRMSEAVDGVSEVAQAGSGALRWRQVQGSEPAQWILEVPEGSSGDTDTLARELLRALIRALPNVEARYIEDFVHAAFASRDARVDRLTLNRDRRDTRRTIEALGGVHHLFEQ